MSVYIYFQIGKLSNHFCYILDIQYYPFNTDVPYHKNENSHHHKDFMY
jgi:hypothetical protein